MVAEAARVSHQVADHNGASRRDQTSVGLQNLHGAEGRDVFRQWIDQPEAPFFKQRHYRGADDRFCHGVKAEDRVGGHGQGRLLVPPAEYARMHNLAATSYQGIDSGIDAAIEVDLHSRTNTFETPGAHSDRLGRFDCVVHAFSSIATAPHGRAKVRLPIWSCPRASKGLADLDDETTSP
jgi:hypothetical protein